jgi:hypothetical protein
MPTTGRTSGRAGMLAGSLLSRPVLSCTATRLLKEVYANSLDEIAESVRAHPPLCDRMAWPPHAERPVAESVPETDWAIREHPDRHRASTEVELDPQVSQNIIRRSVHTDPVNQPPSSDLAVQLVLRQLLESDRSKTHTNLLLPVGGHRLRRP